MAVSDGAEPGEDGAARARELAEAWRARYEQELEGRTALTATIARLQDAVRTAQLAEQLARRETEQAAAQARAARAETARWKYRCDSLSVAKSTIERDELRRERDALLVSLGETRRAQEAKARRRPQSAAETRLAHRQRYELAAGATALLDELEGKAAPTPQLLDPDEEERRQFELLAAQARAARAEADARALREQLDRSHGAVRAIERATSVWRQKYTAEVEANRMAAFSADRSEAHELTRMRAETLRSLSARGVEAECAGWKELAIEREEALRAVHRKLGGLQLGSAPALNVSHDLALRELRHDIERRLREAAPRAA